MTGSRSEAIHLINRGFAVFPIYERDANGRCGCGDPGCRNVAKHPACKNGLRDASRSPLAAERWWRVRPWNIGIATGSPAIVLDVDPRHGGDEALAELEKRHGELPITWRAFTGGGGEHVYLAAPAGRTIPNSANKLGPGLDVRGHGGYVVAPPSRHISGRQYCWSVDHHPDEIELAEMPPWLVDLCAAPIEATAQFDGPRFDPAGFVGAGIVEGARNAKLTSLTGHLLRRYVDPRLALELVAAFNEARCQPPLPHDEMMKIVESIAGRELRRRRAA